MNDATQQLELSRAEHLRQNQRETRKRTAPDQSGGAEEETGPGSLVAVGFRAAALFVFFDIPVPILEYFGITYVFGVLWAIIGWFTVFMWMWTHGYSLFNVNPKKNLLRSFFLSAGAGFIGLPGLSGFVISIILKERAAKAVGQIAGGQIAGKIAKAA